MPDGDIGTRITTPGSENVPSLATLAAAAPTAETPPPPPPSEEEELPPWNEVKQTDAFKNASDDQRALMLSQYASQAGQVLSAKTAGDPKAAAEANQNLKDFTEREGVAIGERYSMPENMARAFTHSALKETTTLLREHADALAGVLKGAENVEPGVITTRSDIRGLSLDQARDQLEQQKGRLKEIEARVPAAQRFQAAAQGMPPDQWSQLSQMPEAKMFQGAAAASMEKLGYVAPFNPQQAVDEAGKTIRSEGPLRQRIDDLQNYINSGGDPNVVPAKEPDITKPFRKMEKWGEGVLSPDAAFAREHPILNTAAESMGYMVPFLAERAAVGALTGGSSFAINAADTTAQLVDTYSQAYKGALAKIDARIKTGEAISPEAREQMAKNDASMQLFNVPFQVFSTMLVGRIMEGGVLSRVEAQGMTNRFVNQVMVPGITETAQQAGLGAGMSAISQMSDQMSGVSKEPFSWAEVGQQAAGMALGPGVVGAGLRGGRVALAHQADQAAINRTVDMVRRAGQVNIRLNPNQNIDDIHENLVKQLPAQIQDSVRAKLNLQKASAIQKEVSDDLKKTGSPQTAAEVDKGITETEQQDTTPPRPTPLTPEQRAAMGENLIHQALVNGHINAEQHGNLVRAFQDDPGGTLQNLGETLGLARDQVNPERLQAITKEKKEVPTGKKEEVPPTPTEEKKKEVPAAGFTTSLGSTYEIHEDGTTTRTKALHPEHPGDVGVKPRSERTVFLTPENADRLAPPAGHYRYVDHGDGTMSLVTPAAEEGKWGVSPSQNKVPYSDKPAVGSIPLELWDTSKGVGFREQHFGNPITEIRGREEAAAPAPKKEEVPPAPPAEKVIPPEMVAGLNPDQTGAVTELVRTHGAEPADAVAAIKKFGPIGNQAELVAMARRLLKKKVPPVEEAKAPPAPTPPAPTDHNALLSKVADYLGPDAMKDKAQRLEFGRDFLASVPQEDRPAAAQLLHRLRLEALPEGEHENWAKIPADQQGRMMAQMSKFIDDRIAAQGRHAAKPVFNKTMTARELFDLVKRNEPEELQSQLLAGRILTIRREDVRPNGPLDTWLGDNKFQVLISADGNQITIGPSGQVRSHYEQLNERYQQLLKAQKRRPGRPTRQVYIVKTNSPEYKAATDAMTPHPAEDAEIEKAMPTVDARLPSDESGELVSGVINKFRRQLREWAKLMVNAGRNDDMLLLGQRTALEMQLTHATPGTAFYEATEIALKNANAKIKETNADREVVNLTDGSIHKHPEISPIISSMDRDYKDWQKSFKETYGETVSMQKPLEEGEEFSLEDTIKERPVTPEDKARPRHFLDTEHEPLVTEFAKQLRTKEEKAYLYEIVNRINSVFERPPIKPSEELPKPTLRKKDLLNRITNEYLRFLESKQPRPAGEGGEEGGETTATAAGRGALSPADYEEAARGPGPGYLGAAVEADSFAARESSSLTARSRGVVAEREPTPGGNRERIAGDPERTSEDQARAAGPAAELPGTAAATAAAAGRAAEEQAGRAGAAGTFTRDPVTGQRIAVTPGGAERGRAPGPRITPEEQAAFEKQIDSQLKMTANRIWIEWREEKKGGPPSVYAKLFGLRQGPPGDIWDNPYQVKMELKQMVEGMVKQMPTLEERVKLAHDILLGLPQFYEESMSASQLRRQRLFDSQTTPVTKLERAYQIVQEAYGRYQSAFAALGVPIRQSISSHIAAIRSSPDGRIEFAHNITGYDQFVGKGLTEGQLRSFAEAVAQEELIHAAQFGWYREQWRLAPGKTYDPILGVIRDRNFNEYRAAKADDLMNSFGAVYETARRKGDYKLMHDLDNALAAAVFHYFGDLPLAKRVYGWDSYNRWIKNLESVDPKAAREVPLLLPYEMSRMFTQLRISGRPTELVVQQLLGKIFDTFMDGLRYLRKAALGVTEGNMGQAWKDTITTLENRVRILQEKIDAGKPPITPQKDLFERSQALASMLGSFFYENPQIGKRYHFTSNHGLDPLQATDAADYANQIMRSAKSDFGNNLELIHNNLYQMAVREGLITPREFTDTPTRDPGKTMYVGRMDSLAPGMEAHSLEEGKPHQLARFLRHSTDPEMREFAKSLTSHREKLMPVVLRQLNNNVPAAFYHNGELFVTRAALDHRDGQKAMAHELQHAIAQEIITKPSRPHEHEAAAHALSLVDELRAHLPADIRDSADHKMPELFDHMDASGSLNLDHVTDEEKAWMPLIEAARNPSELIKKAFSSANFRDFLRNTKADRGGSLWDKMHDWGKTLFGDQAFKYAPEVSDITYNRPGAVMRSDPRERYLPPSTPEEARAKFVEDLKWAGIKLPENWPLTFEQRREIERQLKKARLAEGQPQIRKLPFETELPGSKREELGRRLAGTQNHIEEEIKTLDPKVQERINSFTQPFKAWQNGQLKLTPKLIALFQREADLVNELNRLKDEPPEETYRDIMRKYGFAGGAENVLYNIFKLSTNPYHTQLARALGKSLAGSPRIRMRVTEEPGAGYSLVGDKIRVSPELLTGEGLEEALLHESVHALVGGKVSAYLTGRMDLLTPEERTAIGELEKIRQLAIEWGIKNGELHPDFGKILNLGGYEARQNFYKSMGAKEKGIRDFYGLIDLNELASEALTNPKLQKFLDRIPYKEEGRKLNTLWEKFIDWTKNILGIRRDDTALSAVLKNVAKISEGQRLVHSDFVIDGVTGPATAKMAAARMELDYLKKRAAAENYASTRDVPRDTWESWSQDYRDETMFTGQFSQQTWDGIIGRPKRDSMILPSKELAQKSSAEDIVDHVARTSGTDHLDSEGLRRAVEKAHQDGALSFDQYAGTQDFLDSLDHHTVRYFNPLGDKDDPWSPKRSLLRWGKAFLRSGWLPKELHELQLKHLEYAANELAHKSRAWVADFNTILKKNYGDIKDPRFVPERTMELFNDVLRGKYKSMPEGMPLDMWNHLREGRKMIDDLSEQLLLNGIAKPESDLYLKIQKGLGKYVSASYQIISDPRFAVDKNIRKRYWGAAIAPMKKHWIDVQAHEAADQAARVYRPGTTAYEDARIRRYWSTRNRLEGTTTDAAVEQHMNNLLLHYAQTADARMQPAQAFGPAFMLNDKIVTDLTKLPKEFKRLMGEEQDIRTNLVNTLFRQNQYLHGIQLSKEMLEAGKGKWFADDSDISRGLTHQIPPEISYQRVQGKTPEEQIRKHAIFGSLAGKYTTKEIFDALQGYDKLIRQNPGALSKIVATLESSARYMTTILSVHRGVGNLFAAPFSMIQNGMLPLDPASARATMTYLQHLFGGSSSERNQRIEEAYRYGVLDKNADQAILNDIMHWASKYTEYGRGPLDFLEAANEYAVRHPVWSKIPANIKAAKEFMLKFHTAGNDIAKMAQFEAKQRFLRDVDNENIRMSGGKLTPKTDHEIKEEAGQIVRDTNVSYSLASPALKKARVVPYIGTFLTYWNEMLRSYANQLAYAGKYVTSKNRVEQIEGARRVGGLIVAGGLAFGLGAVSRQMFGVTDRKDRNIRALLPPWEQNDTRLYLGPERNGKLTYINLNYVMPQGDLARGLTALLTPNPQGLGGRVFDAAKEITHPTWNIGLIPGALVDWARNQTEYGTQVYNPEIDLLSQAGAVANHMWGRWAGGTLGRAFNQLPQLGKVSPGGNIYDPYILATKELLGQDIHYISIPDRFRSALFSSKDDIKNDQRLFTGPIQRTNNQMTDHQIAAAYLQMEKARKISFDHLHEKIEAALDSGMSMREVRSALKERGYSGKLAHDLLAGRYRAYRPGKGILKNAREVGNIVPRSLFSSSAIDYDEIEKETEQ